MKLGRIFITKPLAWVAVVAILYVTGALQYASSLAQGVVLRSGFVNASTTSSSSDVFNYNFTIKDLEGKKIEFKDFKGKVLFINLWATWCGPCRSEMPSIQELYNDVDKEKIIFVMLSLDNEEHLERVKQFISYKSFTFPVYMPSGYLTNQFQVPTIPTTFVVAKDGTIALKEIGMKNYNTSKFKKYLEQLASR